MGTILKRKRKDGKTCYLAQIRKVGHPPQAESFGSQAEAQRWITRIEAQLDAAIEAPPEKKPVASAKPTPPPKQRSRGADHKESALPSISEKPEPKRKSKTQEARRLGDLIDRYLKEEMPRKASRRSPTQQLMWWKAKLGNVTLESVTPARLAQMKSQLVSGRTDKGKKRSPSTVNRYLAVLSHVFTVGMKEWFWVEDNPVQKIQKLREPSGRIRFLSDDERERLLSVCRQGPATLNTVVRLSLYTGMRYGEVMGLRWQNIDFVRGRLTLEKTKNRERRGVPLLGPALEALVEWAARNPQAAPGQLLFPSTRKPGKHLDLRGRWRKAVEQARLENFHFHDLRHCTASYMAMSGATPHEIAEVLGHKSLQMVHRYSHLSETHVRGVLAKMVSKFSGDATARV